MKRALLTAFLASIALSAWAQDAERYAVDADVHVNSADACPAGYIASSPTFQRQNGHFVQDGWVCESLSKKK